MWLSLDTGLHMPHAATMWHLLLDACRVMSSLGLLEKGVSVPQLDGEGMTLG